MVWQQTECYWCTLRHLSAEPTIRKQLPRSQVCPFAKFSIKTVIRTFYSMKYLKYVLFYKLWNILSNDFIWYDKLWELHRLRRGNLNLFPLIVGKFEEKNLARWLTLQKCHLWISTTCLSSRLKQKVESL